MLLRLKYALYFAEKSARVDIWPSKFNQVTHVDLVIPTQFSIQFPSNFCSPVLGPLRGGLISLAQTKSGNSTDLSGRFQRMINRYSKSPSHISVMYVRYYGSVTNPTYEVTKALKNFPSQLIYGSSYITTKITIEYWKFLVRLHITDGCDIYLGAIVGFIGT